MQHQFRVNLSYSRWYPVDVASPRALGPFRSGFLHGPKLRGEFLSSTSLEDGMHEGLGVITVSATQHFALETGEHIALSLKSYSLVDHPGPSSRKFLGISYLYSKANSLEWIADRPLLAQGFFRNDEVEIDYFLDDRPDA